MQYLLDADTLCAGGQPFRPQSTRDHQLVGRSIAGRRNVDDGIESIANRVEVTRTL
jgi:hypothetical protein